MKYFLITVLATIFLDQLSKILCIRNFPENSSINSGISFAWDLPRLMGGMRIEFFAVFLSVMIVALFWMYRNSWLENPIFAGLFFGGAVSNVLDRFMHQGVVDWLKIPFTNLTNNLADWAILIGGAGLVVGLIKSKPAND